MEVKKSWHLKKILVISCFLLFLLWIIFNEKSCLFGGLSRKIALHRMRLTSVSNQFLKKVSEHIKVEEIPLDDFTNINYKVTKVQVIPLLTSNESFKVSTFLCKINSSVVNYY